MTLLAAGKVNYRARIERAALLAERPEFAGREILTFYGVLAKFQKEFYESLPKMWGKKPVVPAGGDLRAELNLGVPLEAFGALLETVERHAPDSLADGARNLQSKGSARQGEILQDFWKTGLLESTGPGAEDSSSKYLADFFARAMLQPYADFVTGAMLPPSGDDRLPLPALQCPAPSGRVAARGRWRKALPGMFLLLAGVGIPASFARNAAKRPNKSCPSTWPSNSPMSAWSAARRANISCAPLT